MTDLTQTMTHLADLEEKAIVKAGPALDAANRLLEGRRRIAWAATWLLMARSLAGDRRHEKAISSVGFHLRQAQRTLDRKLSE